MPAKSAKQLRFMRAVEHDPAFAAKVGVPQSVGKEFADATPIGAFGSVRAPSAPAPVSSPAPITMPGGAVQSGGYLANTKFGNPAMPGMRKVRL